MRLIRALQAVVLGFFIGCGLIGPAAAEDLVPAQLDTARAAYARGDSLRALTALQAAIGAINGRLVDQASRTLPPGPQGWDAGPADSQSLDTIGGGLSVSRGFTKGEATVNASLILDNPAVAASAAMFQSAPQVASQPGWSRLKLGSEEALLRFDATTRSGEIILVIGGRALLQVEGTEIAAGDVLVDTAKGWNVAAIRKLIGSGS